ncbi:MAG: imelysin family protein [Polyangia bacterium]|jgi:putative iron-regulated protein
MRLYTGLALVTLASACSAPNPEAAAVHEYAVNLDANYKDVIARLSDLQTAVNAFVQAPSAAGLAAAQQAWLAARPPYGECEVSRFYGGPLDQAQGGMNEWPIDESFIDYTTTNPNGGIINDPTDYPQLTAQVLAVSDERGGIENLSTGFHAIEFLLWGQRVDQTAGPGQRPYTDFVDGGTAANQDRRRTYLKTATDLLLSDMQGLDGQWDLTNPASYGAMMVAGAPKDGLTKMLRGFSNMAISELFYERLSDPYVTQDRKDEESCFSESTFTDLNANALGVEDVYLGRYQMMTGPSLSDLVKAKNPALDMQMRQELSAIRAALAAIPPPFDHAVLSPVGSDAHDKVQAAIDAFSPVQATIDQVAQVLGITINI